MAHELYTFWTSLSTKEKLEWIPFALSRAERGLEAVDKSAIEQLEVKAGSKDMKTLTALRPLTDEDDIQLHEKLNAEMRAAELITEENRYALTAEECAEIGTSNPMDVMYQRKLSERETLRAAEDIGPDLFAEPHDPIDFNMPLEDRSRKIVNIRRILEGLWCVCV